MGGAECARCKKGEACTLLPAATPEQLRELTAPQQADSHGLVNDYLQTEEDEGRRLLEGLLGYDKRNSGQSKLYDRRLQRYVDAIRKKQPIFPPTTDGSDCTRPRQGNTAITGGKRSRGGARS